MSPNYVSTVERKQQARILSACDSYIFRFID